jgi:purine-nucleoside phosphorylase
MPQQENNIREASLLLRRIAPGKLSTALVLGSGLGDFAETLPRATIVPAESIPSYPASTVVGHKGRLVFSVLSSGTAVVAIQGRVHFYESRDVDVVTFPIRLAHALGARNLLVTNAAGGINGEFSPGDLMLVSDQINLTGEHTAARGNDFADGSAPAGHSGAGTAGANNAGGGPLYDPALLSTAAAVAASLGIPVRTGVYAGVKGPSYETAAEEEMIRRLGGDVVGMSTVLEVRAATALGMRVLGISCITNKATGTGGEKLSHDEVTEVASRVRHDFEPLLNGILEALP